MHKLSYSLHDNFCCGIILKIINNLVLMLMILIRYIINCIYKIAVLV